MKKIYSSLTPVDLSGDKFSESLPVGPEESLVHGVLDNGLRYYVRPSKKPLDRVALGLAVRVGSVVEEDNEQGVAHIVEHLAFNATENFTNHDIVKFLESIGAEFGACQNAYTSVDETVYQLVVPSTDFKVMDQALAVLAEFAFRIRCDPNDLDKERGAVLEEWRMGRGAAGRAQAAHWKLLMEGSKYADRLTIGLESVIKNVPAEVVRSFYQRWYHPSRMCVVVVGDFEDPQQVVTCIQQYFLPTDLPSGRLAPAPHPLPEYSFCPHTTPRFKVLVDKEAQNCLLYLSFKAPRNHIGTPEEFKEHMKLQMYHHILNKRLYRLARQQDPPFFMATSTSESITATTDTHVLSAVCIEGNLQKALEAVLTEVARVRVHGFSDRDLEQARAEVISEVEAVYLERDKGNCWEYRDEYIRHFLHGEFVTGQDYEARLTKTLLPTINKEDVEALAQALHPTKSCVVKVVEHRKRHSESELAKVVDKVLAMEAAGAIPAWHQAEATDQLMTTIPEPGSIVSERKFEKLDAVELTLSNGMRVCYKVTNFLEDEVLLTGVAQGGLTEVSRERHKACSLAHAVSSHLGAYGHPPEVMNDLLVGKRAELDYGEGAYYRLFSGVQSPSDLEVALQLIHLLFITEVEVDKEKLMTLRRYMMQVVEAQLRDPMNQYTTEVNLVNYQDCYFFKHLTLEDVESLDPHIPVDHHNQSFSNPAEFVVVLTGRLDPEVLRLLVAQYLASIPVPSSPHAPLKATDVKPLEVQFPSHPIVRDVPVAMISPITQSLITFPVSMPRERAREDLTWLQLICKILETRLLQRLRFRFGKVYTVAVSTNFDYNPPMKKDTVEGDVGIAYTCDPANKDILIEMALEELELLQEQGPSEDQVENARQIERLQYENGQQENSFWQEFMTVGYRSRTFEETNDLDVVYQKYGEAREKVLGELSPSTLREAVRRVFPLPCRSRYTAVTMIPHPPTAIQKLLMLAIEYLDHPWKVAALGGVVAVGAVAAVWGLRSWRRS